MNLFCEVLISYQPAVQPSETVASQEQSKVSCILVFLSICSGSLFQLPPHCYIYTLSFLVRSCFCPQKTQYGPISEDKLVCHRGCLLGCTIRLSPFVFLQYCVSLFPLTRKIFLPICFSPKVSTTM